MTLNIYYNKRLPSFIIKRRTKKFLKGSQYFCRGNVFSYKEASVSFYINKYYVFISVSNNTESSASLINDYIFEIFKRNKIGIHFSDSNIKKYINVKNYVLLENI